MSDPNPFSMLFEPRSLFAFGGVAAAIAAAHAVGPGPTQAVLALLLLAGVPAAALVLGGQSGRVLVLFAAVGVWTSLRQEAFDLSAIPVALLNRLGYVVVPPLILDLVLGERGWQRLKLEPVHVYGPTAVLALGVLVHRVLQDVGPDGDLVVTGTGLAAGPWWELLVAAAHVAGVRLGGLGDDGWVVRP